MRQLSRIRASGVGDPELIVGDVGDVFSVGRPTCLRRRDVGCRECLRCPTGGWDYVSMWCTPVRRDVGGSHHVEHELSVRRRLWVGHRSNRREIIERDRPLLLCAGSADEDEHRAGNESVGTHEIVVKGSFDVRPNPDLGAFRERYRNAWNLSGYQFIS